MYAGQKLTKHAAKCKLLAVTIFKTSLLYGHGCTRICFTAEPPPFLKCTFL